jgi:hypothetical protein
MVLGVPRDVEKATDEELRRFVKENTKALELARVGLGRECGVPLDYSQPQATVSGSRAGDLRQIARLLAAEGQLAKRDARAADAVRSYVDLVRLGHETARGGLIVDQMVGSVCEGMGIDRLQSLHEKLDAAACRDLAQKLDEIEARREPFAEILAREHDLQEAIIAELGFAGRINRSKLLQLARQGEVPAQQKATFIEAKLRGLIRTLRERADAKRSPGTP